MSTKPLRRNSLFAPFIYAVCVVPVLVGVLIVVFAVETTIGLHTLRRVGDIDALIALLVLGSSVFALATHLISRQEHIRSPRLANHLRQCAVLYVLLVGTAMMLATHYITYGGGLSYAYAIVVFASSSFAILINAIVLWQQARRTQVHAKE